MARIRIIGLADGSPTPYDGHYVKEYDANGPNVDPFNCKLITTTNRDEALDLPTGEAAALWRSVDHREPSRADGRPNRPLTAFSVEIC